MAWGAIAGGAFAAAGQIEKARAESRNAEFNAELAGRNAEIIQRRAQYDEERLRTQVRRVVAQQRATFGASGIVVDQGAPFEVLMDTIEEGELQAMAIHFARDINVESQLIEQQSQLTYAEAVKSSGVLAAGGAFFGAAGSSIANRNQTVQPVQASYMSSYPSSGGDAGGLYDPGYGY